MRVAARLPGARGSPSEPLASALPRGRIDFPATDPHAPGGPARSFALRRGPTRWARRAVTRRGEAQSTHGAAGSLAASGARVEVVLLALLLDAGLQVARYAREVLAGAGRVVGGGGGHPGEPGQWIGLLAPG